MKKSKFLLKTAVLLFAIFAGLIACDKDEVFQNESESSIDNSVTTSKQLSSATFLTIDDIREMYLGLSIKGSGGGGSFEDGETLVRSLTEGVVLADVSSADDEKLYIVAGGIGSPASVAQNIDGVLNAIESSVATLVNIEGRELGGVLSVESGSLNAMIALLISQRLNVPLINADGAGRSVPELKNLSYAHEAYGIGPLVLTAPANPGSAINVSHPTDADAAETAIRNIISQPSYGNIGGLALWAQTGAELKNSHIIKNAYTDALELGDATKYALIGNTQELDNYFINKGSFISSYDGTLSSFTEQTVQGLDVVTLEIDLNDGRAMTIEALNENLLLKIDGEVVVTAPNLISYVIKLHGDNAYVPFNNGDKAMMQSLINSEIHVVCSLAEPRLYDIEDTFLSILSAPPFNYHGSVIPPGPTQ